MSTLSIDPKRAVERCQAIAALGRVPAWWRVIARRRWLQAFSSIMAVDITTVAEMLRAVYADRYGATDAEMRFIAARGHPTFRTMRKDS